MRLSSLARKITVKPSELISFFEEQGISLDSGAHTKLSDDQIESAMRALAPDSLEKEEEAKASTNETVANDEQVEVEIVTANPDVEKAEVLEEVSQSVEELKAEPEIESREEDNEEEAEPEEDIEVIRAPKVTLPGLKVKGKIDLPEPKKPEPKEESMNKEVRKDEQKTKKRRGRRSNDDYNPIAAARKRKQEKEERERLAALKQKKKAKEEHYRKMQSKVAKTKQEKERLAPQEVEDQPAKPEASKANALQRFWRWFNS